MRRTIAILAVALACATLASYLVVRYVRQQEQRARARQIELQPIAVATSDISIGTRLTPGVVALRPWPKAGLPQGSTPELDMVVGRVVKGEIARDEPILEHRLFPKDLTQAPGVMSVMVPPGKRAMTVGVNEVVGVSGFILPKNRVDVIATRADGGTQKASKTIVENVEVLAVGQRVEQRADQNIQVPTVTMAVTPAEAERLALGVHDGKIHIVLRSVMDSQRVHVVNDAPASKARGPRLGRQSSPTRSAVAESQVGKAATRSTTKEAPGNKTFLVDVIRGDKRTLETHPAD